MEKQNNKGFLLAESLIVATFVISVLIFLFVQFKNLAGDFDKSFKYNTVENLYALDNIKTYLQENSNKEHTLATLLSEQNKPYISIYNKNENNCLSINDSEKYLRGTGYCAELMEQQNIKNVIFTYSEIGGENGLKSYLRNNLSSDGISENMKNFILKVNDLKGIKKTFRLIAQFNDGSFATFNVGDENWDSSKYNDPNYVNPLYDESATDSSCFETENVTGGIKISNYLKNNPNCPAHVTIPSQINGNKVIAIGGEAFKGKSIDSVTMPNGLKYIENNAFKSNNINLLSIPASVIKIGEGAFQSNSISGTLFITDNVSSIGNSAFQDNGIETLKIGEALSVIGDSAFQDNQISKIHFNNHINSIGNNAFAGNQLTNNSTNGNRFTLPSSLITIGTYAFSNNQISKVVVPASVKTIGNNAFSMGNVSWQSITIEGTNTNRFNGTWLKIGWPLSLLNGKFEFQTDGVYNIPDDGYYLIELWGANGSKAIKDDDTPLGEGGKGAYTSGIAYFEKDSILNFHVGGKGATAHSNQITQGGHNGGGNGSIGQDDGAVGETLRSAAGAGGGATDVRFGGDDLKNRIMVAGGGGGGSYNNQGGAGGALWGGYPQGITNQSTVGKQTTGFSKGNGKNGNGVGYGYGVAGGGGGYYGGKALTTGANNAGGGGSSFVSGYAGVNAVNSSNNHTDNTIHFSGIYFQDVEMYSGNQTNIPAGNSDGSGMARITYIGNEKTKTSNLLKGVKYIRDCINTSSDNHWLEIQAIDNGINVAKGKISSEHLATNGQIDIVSDHFTSSDNCIEINLGNEYNLKEVAIWHYFEPNTNYNNHQLSVKGIATPYRKIASLTNPSSETINGFRVK